MKEENEKFEILIKPWLGKNDPVRNKIKEYFRTRQTNPELTVFTLRLIGFSETRAKEFVSQWTSEKSNEGAAK